MATYDNAMTAAHTAEYAQQERESGIIDRRYWRGIPAITKLVQIILCLIAYICMQVTAQCVPATDGFFGFATCGTMVATAVLWVLLLLKIPQRILRCDCVNWPFIEFVFYIVVIICLFFAALFQSINACNSGHQAAAAFAWFAIVAFAVDFYFTFRLWWSIRRGGTTTTTTTTTTSSSVTVDPKY